MQAINERAYEPDDLTWLTDLGKRIRAARRELGVTAQAAAQAAGVSRMTWHRVETGAPGVSAGAYARALASLGLDGPSPAPDPTPRSFGMIPTRIRVGDWPELAALAWSVRPDTTLTPYEALRVYERNARHLDRSKISDDERALIADLRAVLGDVVQS